MRLTIGRKLTLSFSLVVAIMVAVSGLTFTQIATVVEDQDVVLEHDVPMQTVALKLQGQVHAALSAHRGYIILGLPELKDERARIFEEVRHELDTLAELAVGTGDEPLLTELRSTLEAFAQGQEHIVAVAHTPENLPATAMFTDQVLPLGKTMQKHLEAIVDTEASLPTNPERKALVVSVSQAEMHLLKVTATLTQYLDLGTPDVLATLKQQIDGCSRSVAHLKTQASLFDASQRRDFDAYLQAREGFLAKATRVIEMRGAPDWNLAEFVCAGTVTPLSIRIDELLGEIVAHAGEITREHGESLEARSAFVQWMMVVSTVAAATAAILIAVLLRRAICPPLIRAVEAAQRVADGDLTVTLDAKSNDECGDLARSFNEMTQKVSGIVRHVTMATQEVASAATEIASTSEEMARGMEEQTGQVTQISAAVEQMSASVIEVARKSADASTNAQESGDAARQGGRVVGETIEEMQAISAAVSTSARAVENLGKRGEQIGEIVATINDIADQTNLLALNAAIEAARAGEHGRGFAVVADEVRKLADRTTKATDEIAQSIQAIQAETSEAVSRMNGGTEEVRQGVDRA
ncbi:MAG: methyl-accepting chemotaxis protein, partial [Planctomycetota bacterium]